jgi:hydrogenase nickel incorporation protein HypA/HybF
MHELGIANDLFGTIKQKIANHNFKKITKIRIKVGVASGIDIDFLRHSLIEHTLAGTIAEEAILEIIKEDVVIKCNKCNKDLTQEKELIMKCSRCNSYDIEITKGNGISVENIEGEIIWSNSPQEKVIYWLS